MSEPREITLTVTFKIGTLAQIGMSGLKQSRADAGQDGREYSLTCGAGLGSSLLEAGITEGKRSLYARASISPLASDIFDALKPALEDLPAAVPGPWARMLGEVPDADGDEVAVWLNADKTVSLISLREEDGPASLTFARGGLDAVRELLDRAAMPGQAGG